MSPQATADPYAAYGGATVAPPPPTPTADPYAAYGGSVANAAAPAPPAAPAAPKTGMQRAESALTGENETDPNWQSPYLGGAVSGALKSGANLVGNILDMVSRPRAPLMVQGQDIQTQSPEQLRASQHLQDAAHWLKSGGQAKGFWENVGAIGEQTLEYLGTDGLLKMVGPAAGAVETGEHLKQAQQAAQTLKNHPKIAGLVSIGLKAARDATMQAGQTYLHTEDAGQAAAAGGIGGVLSGVTGIAGMAVKALREMGPKALEIAGEKVPVLANQIDEAGGLTGTTATAQGAENIAATQQAAIPNQTRNIAREGLEKALNRVNKTREIIPPSRQLPAPEGAQPFRFSLEGTPTTETPTGELMQAPRKKQIGTQVVERPARAEGPAAPGATAPENLQGANVRELNPETGEGPALDPNKPVSTNATKLVKEPTFQYMSGTKPGSPEARGEIVGGGGQLVIDSPQQAEQRLQQLEDVQASPEYKRLSPEQQAVIDGHHDALQQQLGMYYSQGSRFAPRDVPAALGWTNTYGDAAAQLHATAAPVYQKLDEVSGDDFSKFRDAAKQALGVLQRGSTIEAMETAQQRLANANQKIDELFTRHGSAVSPADYRAAKTAWRDGSTFDMLHTVTERMANGITMEETATGLPRIVRGDTGSFESWLAKANQFGAGTNRDRVEDLIGKQGLNNMKKMMVLTRDAKLARSTTNALQNIGLALKSSYGPEAAPAAIIGGVIGHFMGMEGYAGAAAGMTAAMTARAVFKYAAHSPQIGNALDFAVRNAVGKEHYAPIIARMIAQAAGLTEPPEQADNSATMAAPNPRGLVEPGNLPLRDRPVVKNADGSVSTEYSTSFQDENGHEVLVPTVVNGKFLTPDGAKPPEGSAAEKTMFQNAWKHYLDTGENLGKFDNSEDADAYAGVLHSRGEK